MLNGFPNWPILFWMKSPLDLVSMEESSQHKMMSQPNNKRPVMEKMMSKSLLDNLLLV